MDKGIKQVVVLLAHPDIKSSQANKKKKKKPIRH